MSESERIIKKEYFVNFLKLAIDIVVLQKIFLSVQISTLRNIFLELFVSHVI